MVYFLPGHQSGFKVVHIWAVAVASQLDYLAGIIQCNAFDGEKWSAVFDVEEGAFFTDCSARTDFLVGDF